MVLRATDSSAAAQIKGRLLDLYDGLTL